MTLRIGKQTELPRRPGDYRSAKGDMNEVPPAAAAEAAEMAVRHGRAPAPPPAAETKEKKAQTGG